MGIPGLFSYVKKHFRECITSISVNKPMSTDHLFIDSNCLLHTSAQFVFNYGEHKRIFYNYKSLSYEEKEDLLLKMYVNKIVEIIHLTNPKKSIYIAIDGPAPLGKELQQRQRRYISSLSSNVNFDSNCITPGTVFMLKVGKYLDCEVKKLILEKKIRIPVYISNSNVPGEGEHKLLENIRQRKEIHNDCVCVFGPDGDLLMLCLALPMKTLLCRGDFMDKFSYNVIDTDIFKSFILEKMGTNSKDAINDFILMGFLLGNDFLPKLKMMNTLESGLNLLFKIYKQLDLTLTKDGVLYFNGLCKFFELLSSHESKRINKQITMSRDERFKDHTLLRNVVDDIVNLKSYSSDLFKKEKTENVVKNYVQGLEWNILYYSSSLPDWKYAYRYHFPPFSFEIVNFLKTNPSNTKFEKNNPPLPFVQLAMVLPPKSASLLPLPYRKILTHKNSPLVKDGFYPSTFEIDLQGKTEEYQGIAILPFIDIDLVQSVYEKFKTKRLERNSVKKEYKIEPFVNN